MAAKVISISKNGDPHDGKQWYKVFIQLDSGEIGYVSRSGEQLPKIGQATSFGIRTGKDSKFTVSVNFD